MSFCYGELSHTPGGVFNESLTEMGVQYDGLCVRLRTHTTLGIEITACKRNQCTTLNGVRIGGALRTESFAPVTFSRLPGEGVKAAFEAGPNGTSIELNVSEADLSPYYEPAVTWRFGFGARCGQYADGHHVDAISIRSPAFVSTHTLPFSVANNGQQFSEAAGGTSQPFEYYTPPEVSSFSPSSGPIFGDTRVVVHGVGGLSVAADLAKTKA